MEIVSISNARAGLSEILNRIASGGEVVITRRGKAVAKLSPFKESQKPIDFSILDSLRARQARSRIRSVDLIRKMRNQKY